MRFKLISFAFPAIPFKASFLKSWTLLAPRMVYMEVKVSPCMDFITARFNGLFIPFYSGLDKPLPEIYLTLPFFVASRIFPKMRCMSCWDVKPYADLFRNCGHICSCGGSYCGCHECNILIHKRLGFGTLFISQQIVRRDFYIFSPPL